jgi:hypothetical protein
MCCHLVFCVLFIASRAGTSINYVDWKWQDTSQPEHKALLTLQGLDNAVTKVQRSSTVGQPASQTDRQHWHCRLRKMAPPRRFLSALRFTELLKILHHFTALPHYRAGMDNMRAYRHVARAPPRCRYFWCSVSLETSLAESRVCLCVFVCSVFVFLCSVFV